MSRTTERERIEQLAQLLDGELAPDAAGAALRSLADLAATVRHEIALERPDPAFKAALRAQLVDAAAAAQPPVIVRIGEAIRERGTRARRSAKLATATATASMMLGTAGVAAAAQSALPGDALYGVKSATESLRFAFAAGSEETGRLHLAMAAERLDEIADGLDRLTSEQVIDTLGRMDASSALGAEELLRAFEAEPSLGPLRELQSFSTRQRTILTDVMDQLPVEAKPAAEGSLELLRRIEIALESSVAACGCGLEGLLAATIAGDGIAAVGADATSGGDGDSPHGEPQGATGGGSRVGAADTTGSIGTVGSVLGGHVGGTEPGTGTTAGTDGSGDRGTAPLGVPTELGGATSGTTLGETAGTVTDTATGATDPVDQAVAGTTATATETAAEVAEQATETVTDTASEVGGATGDTLP